MCCSVSVISHGLTIRDNILVLISILMSIFLMTEDLPLDIAACWVQYHNGVSCPCLYFSSASLDLHVLNELHLFIPTKPTLQCENIGIAYFVNLVFHQCVKQFEINVHFIHDMVLKRTLKIRCLYSCPYWYYIDKENIFYSI